MKRKREPEAKAERQPQAPNVPDVKQEDSVERHVFLEEKKRDQRMIETLTTISSVARTGRTVMARFPCNPVLQQATVEDGIHPKTLSMTGLRTNKTTFTIKLHDTSHEIFIVQKRYGDEDLKNRDEKFIHPLDMRYLERGMFAYPSYKNPSYNLHLVFVSATTGVDLPGRLAIDLRASFHIQATEDVIQLLLRLHLATPLGRLVVKYLLDYHRDGVCPCIACAEENVRQVELRRLELELQRLRQKERLLWKNNPTEEETEAAYHAQHAVYLQCNALRLPPET